MAKYTIELDDLHRDPMFVLFDFEYKFYTDDAAIKKAFEQKFLNHYRFDEIGFETVSRFKHNLKSRLNLIARKYEQLYVTELKSNNIEFLLNKDYKETYTKEIERETNNASVSNDNSNSTQQSKVDANSSGTNGTESKVSNVENGLGQIGLADGLLTGVAKETGENSGSSSSQTNASTESQGTRRSEASGTGNESESYTLIGQGNIGTTSSAELLEKWRSVLINIDELIIKDLQLLFMQVY